VSTSRPGKLYFSTSQFSNSKSLILNNLLPSVRDFFIVISCPAFGGGVL
jgi:hypothetical protein